MPVITIDEFRKALRNQPLEDLVRNSVFQGETFYFVDCPGDLDELKATINRRLGCEPDNITVIGSAKTGFSLDPENFPREFTESSDIDVLVVDPILFDKYWHAMLKWHYLQGRYVGKADVNWAATRKEEIFWGWLQPDKIWTSPQKVGAC